MAEIKFEENYIDYECGQPDSPGPGHIFQTPAFSKKNPPQNYWGLHMWRVCNHFTIQFPQGYNSNSWGGKPTCDWNGTNTYSPNTVGPFYFWGCPLATRYWTGSSWAYNVTGTTPSGYLPLLDYPVFNYFYDWAVQSIGPINVGDKIEFNCCEQQDPWIGFVNSQGRSHPSPMCLHNVLGGTGSGNKICLEYLGRHYIGGHPLIHNPTGAPTPVPWPIYLGQYWWDGTFMTTNMMNATVYSMKNYPEENPTCCKNFEHDTSWDCVQIGDHPKFGFKCVEIYGVSGQYETKQECLDAGCKEIDPDPGVPTSNIGQQGPSPAIGGTGGTIGGSTGSQSASRPRETGGTGESPSGGRDSSYGG